MRTASVFPLAMLLLAGAPVASSQSISAEPNFGSLSLNEGFVPDPQSVAVTSGGSIDVGVGGCSYGFVSDAPDVDFYYTTSGNSDLYIYAVGDGDTTLLINTPSGSWVCNDDSYGDGDPLLRLPNADNGLYNIWVGSYSNEFHDATLFVSEVDPSSDTSSGAPNGGVPDYSLDPTYGRETLEEGFLPDPYAIDVVAGGPIELSMGECTYGYVADAPDFDLYYETTGGSNLYIYALSEDDTTLLINTPDGNWVCNDDGHFDGNPLIVIPAGEGGLYDIWVGSYNGDGSGATLYISEIDPR